LIKSLLVVLTVLLTFTTSRAENVLEIDEAGQVNANLQNFSLAEAASFFQENYSIKFIGADELFEPQIALSFNKLSLEKALKKIFAKTNVAFKYDDQGKITEVRLLPTSQKRSVPVAANNLVNPPEPTVTDEQENQAPDATDDTVIDQAEQETPPDDASVETDSSPEPADIAEEPADASDENIPDEQPEANE